jgi:hypothetical protein
MENVKAWIGRVNRELAEPGASGLLIYSNAWLALEKGALANYAMDVAALAGQSGWFWVESSWGPIDKESKAKRLAMRALCMADMDALSDAVQLLSDQGLRVRAVSATLSDPRVSHEQAWDLLIKTWPLGLSLDAGIKRPCQDWRCIAALLTQCSINEVSKIYKVFGGLLGELDTRGHSLGTTWLSFSCKAGQGLEVCANALRVWLDYEPNNHEEQLGCQKALANGVADYCEKMSDIGCGCASKSYWRAWEILAGPSGGDWIAWVKSCHRGIDQLSDSQKKSVGFSIISDGLDQYKSDRAGLGFDFFEEIVTIIMMLRKPWRGLERKVSISNNHYVLLAEESLIGWALEISKTHGDSDQFVQALNKVDQKASTRLLKKMLEQGLLDGEENKPEQDQEDRKSKRL